MKTKLNYRSLGKQLGMKMKSLEKSFSKLEEKDFKQLKEQGFLELNLEGEESFKLYLCDVVVK